MQLRIFTEPQQGADVRRPARRRAGAPRRPASTPSSGPTTTCDGRRRPARPDRRLGDAGRAGPGDQPDPARHPGDAGHVPAAGPAGDLGRPGRPDERRPGRAGHRRGLVRGGAHARTASRSRRWASGSTGSRSSSQIVTGLWSTPPGETFAFDGATTAAGLARRCPSRSRRPHPDHRRRHRAEADAAAGRPVRRRVQHASPSSRGHAPMYDRVRAGVRGGGPATGRWSTPPCMTTVCGRDDAEIARRAAAIGQPVEQLKDGRAVRHPGRDRRHAGRFRRRRSQPDLPAGDGPGRPRAHRTAGCRGAAARLKRAMPTYFVSRYSSMPSTPPSRPRPDCLDPAERRGRVGDDALVDADHAGLQPLGDRDRPGQVAR